MLVDVHTHILPGIDDGAQDLQASRAMLKMLAQDGVRDVVLTPHFYFRRQTMADFLENRKAAYERLMASGVGGIRLHLGAEVEFSNLSVDYGLFRQLSIDGGRYILLELPYRGALEQDILPKLERLIYHTGLQPIIAHVERYQGICDRPSLISELIHMGCLLQVNVDSVMECGKGSLVDAMLRKGQVHLLGSDCHNTTSRKPSMRPALVRIGQQYGMEHREALKAAAEAVVKGVPVSVCTDSRIRKIFGKYR